MADTLSWRKFVVGTLLSLIVFLSLHGATPPQASTDLPGIVTTSLVGSKTATDLAAGTIAAIPPTSGGPTAAAPAPAPRVPAKPVAPAPAASTPAAPAPALAPAPAPPAAPAPAVALAVAPEPAPALAPAPTQAVPTVATQASSGKTVGDVAGYINHTVAPGEDFDTMAAKYETTAEAIAEASGLPTSQILYDGMVVRIPTTDPAKVEPALKAVAIPWSDVNAMWAVGTVAQVTDVETGNVFYVMRRGGWAHADVEPISARDTATILSDYGGEFNWARRSIVVVVAGRRIAASQNFMPHGQKTLQNNDFPGHFCIHFLGSTTHGSSYTSNGVPTLDPEHQKHVREAIGY